jgi:hypothetical protein
LLLYGSVPAAGFPVGLGRVELEDGRAFLIATPGKAEAVAQMMSRYDRQRVGDMARALREILQELALLGLWRAKFFDKAAFYGGTALRILYGLDRSSEDLGFPMLQPTPHFRLERYSVALEQVQPPHDRWPRVRPVEILIRLAAGRIDGNPRNGHPDLVAFHDGAAVSNQGGQNSLRADVQDTQRPAWRPVFAYVTAEQTRIGGIFTPLPRGRFS